MKIAFIHYHLEPGGVTTVLKEQVKTIRGECRVLVLTGEPLKSPFPADTIYVPGLGYDDGLSGKRFNHNEVAESVIKAIHSKFKGGCDVLHIHNPTLAKNKNFLKIIKALQKRKVKLFLQIHDFAEDGRPSAYFYDDEYLSDCHYGVINSRDYNILSRAGLIDKGLHKIFNIINPVDLKQEISNRKEFVLYPVRVIRRKNFGEAILLSLFFRNKETLAVTLPPNSPEDIKSYTGWKKFVSDKNLDIEFESGLKHNFHQLLLLSQFCITTSITEGFGFSFIEPWIYNKMLKGRKIPEICYDFEKRGIKLDHMYKSILVPARWIDKKVFYERWKASILKNSAIFNYIIDEEKIKKSFAKITTNNTVDFGLLDEAFQKLVISRVLTNKKDAGKLIQLNPCILHIKDPPNNNELIQNNKNAVLSSYNRSIYKNNLMKIYATVIAQPVHHSINKKILFSHFLNLESFSLLKWGDYID